MDRSHRANHLQITHYIQRCPHPLAVQNKKIGFDAEKNPHGQDHKESRHNQRMQLPAKLALVATNTTNASYIMFNKD